MSPRDLENAKRKSIGKEKRAKKIQKMKEVTQGFLILTTAMLIGIGLHYGYQKLSDHNIVKDVRPAYVEQVQDNYVYSSETVEYDNYENALAINTSLSDKGIYQEKDILLELYKMYRSMKELPERQELVHMNEIQAKLKHMHQGNAMWDNLPNKFTELVARYGFLKESGELDMRAYSKAMDDLILRSEQLDMVESNLEERLRGK